jgi:hypothetical protein
MRFCTFHAERFLDGRKTALLLPAIPRDRYQAVDGSPWQARDDGFEHHHPVHSIHQAGRHVLTEGEVLSLRSLETGDCLSLRVLEIHSVECARLSDQDLADLGYPSRDRYDAEWGRLIQHRRAWLLRVTLVSPAEPLLH